MEPILLSNLVSTTDTIRNDLLSKEELIPKFGVVNYVVFAAMLFISAVIGAYFWWRGQKNTEEFLMAGRSMGTFPMTLSLIASFMSAITLLGTPAEMYVSGNAQQEENSFKCRYYLTSRRKLYGAAIIWMKGPLAELLVCDILAAWELVHFSLRRMGYMKYMLS